MFRRAHHQRILRLLKSLDGGLLSRCRCYFAGGTAIVLVLDEYRESLDVGFLCASQEGYRTLRGVAFDHGIKGFSHSQPKALRDLRTDQYGIRTFLSVDNIPIRFEIVREARIPLRGRIVKELGVPRLIRADLFCSKLLANADRYADSSSAARDIIDLAMMVSHWGRIPQAAWEKAHAAYGSTVAIACNEAIAALRTPGRLETCMGKLKMDMDLAPVLLAAMDRITPP